jgi:hypothetical protein
MISPFAAIALLFVCSIFPLGAEEKETKPTKPPTPSVGVLRLKEPPPAPALLKLSDEGIKQALQKLYQLHQACFAYASGNDQVFPVGKSANEAFRQLFIAGLMDDEMLFFLGAKQDKPDGNIGTANNGYKEALTPGECQVSYIKGLTSDRDDSTLPLLFAKVQGEDGNIYVIVVRIGGNAKIYETKDGIVKDMKNGKMVDILSEEYGTDPENIVTPEAKP